MSEVHDEHPIEEILEAPARGSAEELLDAHAGDPLDPMRHSAAHVMAEAVLGLFPGTRAWASGRPSATASTTTSSCPGPSRPTTSRRSRPACARRSRPTTRSCVSELPPAEGRAFCRDAGSPSRWRSWTTWARRGRGRPAPPGRLHVHPWLVRGPVPRPARGLDRRDRAVRPARAWPAPTGAATRSGRCSSASTAWATARRSWTPTWRREEAKKRDHRRLGGRPRPLQLRRGAGVGLLAPQGPAPVAHAGGRDARPPAGARLR